HRAIAGSVGGTKMFETELVSSITEEVRARDDLRRDQRGLRARCKQRDHAEVAAGLTVDIPAPLPVQVSISAMLLSVDGTAITHDPAKSVTLSMVTDQPGATFYQYNIYELRENAAATGLESHVAYVAMSDQTTVTVPSDVFVTGKTYFIRAHAIKG
ncbi:MAG TPA: hypothetical protein VGC41_25030, partial [Kofleriaceae bacterium]